MGSGQLGLDFLITLFIPVHPCHTGVASHIWEEGMNLFAHTFENWSAYSGGNYFDTVQTRFGRNGLQHDVTYMLRLQQ